MKCEVWSQDKAGLTRGQRSQMNSVIIYPWVTTPLTALEGENTETRGHTRAHVRTHAHRHTHTHTQTALEGDCHDLAITRHTFDISIYTTYTNAHAYTRTHARTQMQRTHPPLISPCLKKVSIYLLLSMPPSWLVCGHYEKNCGVWTHTYTHTDSHNHR